MIPIILQEIFKKNHSHVESIFLIMELYILQENISE